MSIFDAAHTTAPTRPLTVDMLAKTLDQLREQSDRERARQARPGYCRHQDLVVSTRAARLMDGLPCPWCQRTLRAPGSTA